MSVEVIEWSEIADEFDECLLLGNGASIALHSEFKYSSLFKKACEYGYLSQEARTLFDRYGNTDFEQVLRMLDNARQVNEVLGVEEDATEETYEEVKEGLIQTVRQVHAKYEDVEGNLPNIARFMRRFDTVLSLNYDLIVYWALLVGREMFGEYAMKDCWVREDKSKWGLFDPDYDEYMRRRYMGSGDPTLIFYPHGNLALVQDSYHQELKTISDEGLYLLDTVLERWSGNAYRPLFVSEGNALRKALAIGRSSYLHTVLEQEVKAVTASLVIYGWSAGEQDRHILEAVLHGEPQAIAISVHDKSSSALRRWKGLEDDIRKHRGLASAEIVFFDSESEGCWARCES